MLNSAFFARKKNLFPRLDGLPTEGLTDDDNEDEFSKHLDTLRLERMNKLCMKITSFLKKILEKFAAYVKFSKTL